MKDCWPFDVGLRGQASNHPVLRWPKTVVVSDREKARRDRVRWGSGRRARSVRPGRPARASLMRRRKNKTASKPRVLLYPSGRAWRMPRCTGQAVPGVEAAWARSAALARNVRRRASILRRLAARGSVPRQKPKAPSTDAAPAGGPVR